MAGAAAAVSRSEREYILQGCRDDCRVDGRSRLESRPYSCVVNDLDFSYGSARVFLATGATHIVVSIKAELVVPAAATSRDIRGGDRHRGYGNDEGVMEVHVDFMHGKGRTAEDDLESTLTTLLVPHLVDPKDLCVTAGHYVWKLNIDIIVVASGGGSLVDACSLGIRAALQKTLLPRITLVPSAEGTNDGRPTIQVGSDIQSAQPIPGVADGVPVIVTVSVLRDNQKTPLLIVDATGQEESCAFAQVHVVLDEGRSSSSPSTTQGEPMICALHKAGGGALPFGLLQDITSFALEASRSTQVQVSESLQHLLQDNFSIQ